MKHALALPCGVCVFERGWLSSNNILFVDDERTVLVDTGYHSHAGQTVSLTESALEGRQLDMVINTHLHSDHCGGNAALQARYPKIQTTIPPGQAGLVSNWDPAALTYTATGQHCPQFKFNSTLMPGSSIRLGGVIWEIHSAPGHDPSAVIFFEPAMRILISADALWEDGFGVVFPELEGMTAFSEAGATLDLIGRLEPKIVIPGHGHSFVYEKSILEKAQSRLEAFIHNPGRHARHAAKVLLKFKLLEVQRQPLREFIDWALRTTYFDVINHKYFNVPLESLIVELCEGLVTANVARIDKGHIFNA
jgi:glyoxylase-like metal-dependent hydrolase (beta-lactamase superfamily II)